MYRAMPLNSNVLIIYVAFFSMAIVNKHQLRNIVVKLWSWISAGGIDENYPPRAKAREKAMAQFSQLKLRETTGALLLDGATAEILSSDDSYNMDEGKIQNYSLTLFVLAPEGRHFHFISSETGTPYTKFLLPERAKLILKEKFKDAVGQAEVPGLLMRSRGR